MGLILERVCGAPYSSLLEERIDIPAGLRDAGLGPPAGRSGERAHRLLHGYGSGLLPLRPHRIHALNRSWTGLGFSAGGIVSTSRNLLVFIDAHAATIDKMAQFLECTDGDIPEQTGYGLGLRRLVGEGAAGDAGPGRARPPGSLLKTSLSWNGRSRTYSPSSRKP